MSSTSLLQTPPSHEPLPRYTRDPETASIRSSAPSYSSEVPSYHSSHNSQRPLLRSHTSPQPSLPSSRYAPGYHRNGSVANLQNHTYNISEWSSATNGPRARHYQAVANRRATMANEASALISASHLGIRPDASFPTSLNQILQPSIPETETPNEPAESAPNAPAFPLEDPTLVGPEAAARAKTRRLFLARCAEEEVLKEEGKAWDFMMAQMADWGERERAWEGFRKGLQKPRFLGGIRERGLRAKGKR